VSESPSDVPNSHLKGRDEEWLVVQVAPHSVGGSRSQRSRREMTGYHKDLPARPPGGAPSQA